MHIKMADLQAQFASLREEISAAVAEVMTSCRFILGPNVSALEEEIASYCGADYAVGVASGTDAILLSLAACGVGPGDEVITTPFTFVATTEVIALLGAKPVYVDLDPETYIMRADLVEAAVTPRTKAILPVHLYGQTADMTALTEISERRGIPIVSDGAQAIGAAHQGRGIGQWGLACTLSFFPTKNLGGAGDGGMVLTCDEEFAKRVRTLRFHGSAGSYSYDYIGWCSRLDEIQAAVLRVKLKKLDEWTAARARHAGIYNEALKDSGLGLPRTSEGNLHVWHQYTLRSEKRDELKAFLKEREIDSAVYYPGPLHLQPAYAKFGYKQGDFPEAERACRQALSIPVCPEISDDACKTVAGAIREFQSEA